MKRKKISAPRLIIFSLVSVMLISITVALALRYFRAPLTSITYEGTAQQTTEKSIVKKNMPSGAYDISEDEVLVSQKSAFVSRGKPEGNLDKKAERASQEEIASLRKENDNQNNIALPDGTLTGQNSVEKDAGRVKREQRSVQIARVAGPEDPPTYPESNTDGTIESVLTGDAEDYVLEDEPLPTGEEKNDSPAQPQEEDNQVRKEVSDSNVSISRYLMSGSVDQGEIGIILSVYVGDNPPNGLIVKEHIPEGWEIVESSPAYKNLSSSSGEIKWLFTGNDIQSMEISYKILRVDASPLEVSFSGIYFYNSPEGHRMSVQIEDANGA